MITTNDDLLALLKQYKDDILDNYRRGLNKSALIKYEKGSIRTGSEACVLYAIIRDRKYRQLIEIGTGPGFGALYFAQALKDEHLDGTVHTIDVNPGTEARCLPVLKRFGLDPYVRFHLGNSSDIVPALDGRFDFCLIDGFHSVEQVSIDFDNVYPKIVPGGAIAFHDVYPGPANAPGIRSVIDDIVSKKPGTVIYFSEQLFDFFAFREDLDDARRISEKWRKHRYSYASRSANPKELMCVFLKQ